jgi:hypothetical protein
MKKKPSLDEFRSGGSEGAVDSTVAAAAPVASVPAVAERANKTIRIRKVFEAKLKEDAYHRSIAEGRRVTESDIIDEALEKYFTNK